jgi:hypothetical protein
VCHSLLGLRILCNHEVSRLKPDEIAMLLSVYCTLPVTLTRLLWELCSRAEQCAASMNGPDRAHTAAACPRAQRRPRFAGSGPGPLFARAAGDRRFTPPAEQAGPFPQGKAARQAVLPQMSCDGVPGVPPGTPAQGCNTRAVGPCEGGA